MRILFTGATSFTGHWFVRELSQQGHEVTAAVWKCQDHYSQVRRQRLAVLEANSQVEYNCPMGSERFMGLLEDGWDLFCHHAAKTENYKQDSFDIASALAVNTNNVDAVCRQLQAKDCNRVLLTGSFFESDEGAGSEELPAFSPYGLSKALTADVFRFTTRRIGMRLGKFVISNPFGPYEDARFTSYLAKTWFAGEKPVVRTPAYIRDNIHVSLLAKCYARFVAGLDDSPGFSKTNPSGYVETQGAFAQRCGRELTHRLGIPCPVGFAEQTEFAEPRIRINTDVAEAADFDWSEAHAWDELALYYQTSFANQT